MPIGTSDGRNFDDEFQYAVGQINDYRTIPDDPFTNQYSDQSFDKRVYRNDNDWAMHGPQSFPPVPYALNPEAVASLPQSSNIEDRRGIPIPQEEYGYQDLPMKPFEAKMQANPERPITEKDPLLAKPMNEPFKDDTERRGVIDKLLGLTGDRYQLWPEKAARSLIDAFKLPGDVAQGKADPLSDQSIGRAAELAGAVIFGPAPVAKAAVDGTLGTIAGISAKNADKEMLDMARVLDRRGYPNEEIYQTTGWFKGFDNKWKFELPVQNADLMPLNFEKGQVKTLPDVLHFPDLYEAYPALKDVQVIKHNLENALAYYQHGDQPTIGLSNQLLNMKDGGKQLDIILHEVQHAIQHSENFELARGGFREQTKALTKAIQDKVKSFESPEEAVAFLQKATDLTRQAKANAEGLGLDVGKVLYARDPGEAEANMIGIRRQWTPTQRAYESPVGSQNRLENLNEIPSVVRFPYRE